MTDHYIEIASIDMGENPSTQLTKAIAWLHEALDNMYVVSLPKEGDFKGELETHHVKYGPGYGFNVVFKRHRTVEEMVKHVRDEAEREESNERFAARRAERTKQAAKELGVSVEQFEKARTQANGY